MKRHNDQPIQDVLKDLLNKGKLEKGYHDQRVRSIWNENLGKMILPQTERIWYAKGIIYLQLNSAPLRTELVRGKQTLIDSFNRELEANIIKDIKFI